MRIFVQYDKRITYKIQYKYMHDGIQAADDGKETER